MPAFKKTFNLLFGIIIIFSFASVANADVIAVYCSPDETMVQSGTKVAWEVIAMGGSGTYSYTWSGNGYTDGTTVDCDAPASNKFCKQYSNSGASPVIREAHVLVDDGTNEAGVDCAVAVNVYPAISVNCKGDTSLSIGENGKWTAEVEGGIYEAGLNEYTYKWESDADWADDNSASNGQSVSGYYDELTPTDPAEPNVITVTVKDCAGNTASDTCEVTVRERPLTPYCAVSPNPANTTQMTYWDGNAIGGNGSYTSYVWSGDISSNIQFYSIHASALPTSANPIPGPYVAVLTVNDVPTRTATATAEVSGGKITEINLVDKGLGYTSPPVVTISGGDGKARAVAVLDRYNYNVESIDVRNQGSGYTEGTTTVTLTPPCYVLVENPTMGVCSKNLLGEPICDYNACIYRSKPCNTVDDCKTEEARCAFRWCGLDAGAMCVRGGQGPTICNNDTQCETTFNTCKLDESNQPVCTDGCAFGSKTCEDISDCQEPSRCTIDTCTNLPVCAPGVLVGEECTTNADCKSITPKYCGGTPQNPICSNCIEGSTSCDEDYECGDPKLELGCAINKCGDYPTVVCVPGGQGKPNGDPCKDTENASDCWPVGCNDYCGAYWPCPQNCRYCIGNVCDTDPGRCGDECTTSYDCDRYGDCPVCSFDGKCIKETPGTCPSCGYVNTCNSEECWYCVDAVCQEEPGECGDGCATEYDCDQYGDCPYCSRENICVSEKPQCPSCEWDHYICDPSGTRSGPCPYCVAGDCEATPAT